MRMNQSLQLLLLVIVLCSLSIPVSADTTENVSSKKQGAEQMLPVDAIEMLASLGDLKINLQKQITLTRDKIKSSESKAEKERLETELLQLDKQLSETSNDFERIATGVDAGIFNEEKKIPFSWKEEVAALVEPVIKEIKRWTERARQKTKLKDTVTELSELEPVAAGAVKKLELLAETAKDKKIQQQLKELLPEYRNTENRIRNKLELANLKLTQLQEQDESLVESTSNAIRRFFRDRGLYLLLALMAFCVVVFSGYLLHRLIFRFLPRSYGGRRPFHIRLLDLALRVSTLVAAIAGLFFVLYMTEDWFLLSMTIIFFLGLAWTVRQAVPRLWQQGRLMLNIGSVREGERVQLHGVGWIVETINVFCVLSNPALGIRLRIPIEDVVGMVSRECPPDESWFPCKKGDWIVVDNRPRAKVISLSHEMVETVERGGKRCMYQTGDLLSRSLINLSRNFRIRVTFGLSYDLQPDITADIPTKIRQYIEKRMEAEGYAKNCLNLVVEFKEANVSSLDLLIMADFEGELADIYSRLERAVQRWCVDAATTYNWEIPFPQLTVHKPAG